MSLFVTWRHFFTLNNTICSMIANICSDTERQTPEHVAPLLGICLPGLRASLDNGAGAWP